MTAPSHSLFVENPVLLPRRFASLEDSHLKARGPNTLLRSVHPRETTELHDARTEVRGTASTFKDRWACMDIRSG